MAGRPDIRGIIMEEVTKRLRSGGTIIRADLGDIAEQAGGRRVSGMAYFRSLSIGGLRRSGIEPRITRKGISGSRFTLITDASIPLEETDFEARVNELRERKAATADL